MLDVFRSREFLLFIITGGLAALVNFGSRILLNDWLGFSFAVVVAYMIGMITAFYLAKYFVFNRKANSDWVSATRFGIVNAVAVAQTWVVSHVLAYYVLPNLSIISFRLEIAHGIGVAFPVFSSYLGHKYWSFKT